MVAPIPAMGCGAIGFAEPEKQHIPTDIPLGYARCFCWQIIGAGEGIRTLDPNLGKVVLYP